MADVVHMAAWQDRVAASESDLKAEQALLGCLLLNPGSAVSRLPAGFSSTHYADPLHRDIHDAIVAIGPAATPITIRSYLGTPPEGVKYLGDLVVAGVGIVCVPDYAGVVSEAHYRREIKAAVASADAILETGTGDLKAVGAINLLMAKLDAIMVDTHHYGAGGSLDASMDAALDAADKAVRGESVAGRSTGMPSVDEALGGLENGTFNVLGARPGQGKTGLAVQWAVNVAKACQAAQEGGVLGFSLEMPRVALGRRVLAEAARIPVVDIKRGRVDGRMEKLIRVRRDLSGLPLWIEDAGGQNLTAIRQRARSAQRRFKRLALIWVDHINIVKPDDADRKNGATQAVGRISNALRDLSKEFDCPVLCLAQLNRGLLARDDKRPNLSDLRQAGDIEQDADTVMFIHREEAYLPDTPPPQSPGETAEKWQSRVRQHDEAKARAAGKAELIFSKVRDGATCTVNLRFDGPTTSFSEPGADTMPIASQARLQDYADRWTEPEGLWPA